MPKRDYNPNDPIDPRLIERLFKVDRPYIDTVDSDLKEILAKEGFSQIDGTADSGAKDNFIRNFDAVGQAFLPISYFYRESVGDDATLKPMWRNEEGYKAAIQVMEKLPELVHSIMGRKDSPELIKQHDLQYLAEWLQIAYDLLDDTNPATEHHRKNIEDGFEQLDLGTLDPEPSRLIPIEAYKQPNEWNELDNAGHSHLMHYVYAQRAFNKYRTELADILGVDARNRKALIEAIAQKKESDLADFREELEAKIPGITKNEAIRIVVDFTRTLDMPHEVKRPWRSFKKIPEVTEILGHCSRIAERQGILLRLDEGDSPGYSPNTPPLRANDVRRKLQAAYDVLNPENEKSAYYRSVIAKSAALMDIPIQTDRNKGPDTPPQTARGR